MNAELMMSWKKITWRSAFIVLCGLIFLVVNEAEAGGPSPPPPPPPPPDCTISPSTGSATIGSPVTLSWTVYGYPSGPNYGYIPYSTAYLYHNGGYIEGLAAGRYSTTVVPNTTTNTYSLSAPRGYYTTYQTYGGEGAASSQYTVHTNHWVWGSCSTVVYASHIQGCTDGSALNYNPSATQDNGSCTYTVPGCTDGSALNYNPSATQNNGSCTYAVYGCTDVTATNYDSDATSDDGSCEFTVNAPLISLSASQDLVRSGDTVTLEWDPQGFLGACSLKPNRFFVGGDASIASSIVVEIENEITFSYECLADTDVYFAPTNSQLIEATVRVVPRFE